MFTQKDINGENRPRKRGLRGLAVLCAVMVTAFSALIPASASSVINCDKLSFIRIGSSKLSFKRFYVSDFVVAPEAVWWQPVNSDGETPTSDTDFEMHFNIGTRIEAGDTYTMTYDIYFPAGFTASSQILMPGLNENYISATGSWVSVAGERFFHFVGNTTVTAGYATSEIVFIPRGLSPSNAVCVNELTISIRGKDYSNTIDNTKNEIKQNSDKNTDKIIENDKQLQQNEKDEAGSGGNAAIDKSKSAIPSVDGGFLQSINNLVKAMSYEGVNCDLIIPRVYVPAVAGNAEFTLMDESTYNLGYQIRTMLPTTVLYIMQNLFSIAIIFFFVKELYGTIEYVLTLRRGKDE